MGLTDIPPDLKVQKTINHPVDDIRVIGFHARNTTLGHDCILFKGEELPTVREGPSVTHYVIPDECPDSAHVYITDEFSLYYVSSYASTQAVPHTGRKYQEDVPGEKVAVDDCTSWTRESCTIR